MQLFTGVAIKLGIAIGCFVVLFSQRYWLVYLLKVDLRLDKYTMYMACFCFQVIRVTVDECRDAEIVETADASKQDRSSCEITGVIKGPYK